MADNKDEDDAGEDWGVYDLPFLKNKNSKFKFKNESPHPSITKSDQPPGPRLDCLVEGDVDEYQDGQGQHAKEDDGQDHGQDDVGWIFSVIWHRDTLAQSELEKARYL